MINIIIEHNNIIYMSDIPELGGTSTYVYEMVKKYCNKDIAVVYKTAYPGQIARINQYCRAYRLGKEDKIKCKVCVINYDTSALDQTEADEIYMVFHADYSEPCYKLYPKWNDPRITKFISITKTIQKKMKNNFGIDSILSYNPLDVETNKRLILVSATRLSPIKGKNRMITLANALDRSGIDYIWYIFTNDTDAIKNEHIVYIKPRLDVIKWIKEADYVVQLSDTEACSYTINEALYSNVPIIVTPLPYLQEIGVKDGENAYILNFDCSNVLEVAERIKNIPKFNFKHLEDDYENILAKGQRRKPRMVKLRCLVPFRDMEETKKQGKDYWRKENEEFIVDDIRATQILSVTANNNKRLAEVIETIEEPQEKAEKIKEEKTKRRNNGTAVKKKVNKEEEK